MSEISRREFVGGLAAMRAASVPMAERRGFWPQQDQVAAAQALLQRAPGFDLHTHPGLFPLKDIPNSANPREYFGDEAVRRRVNGMRDAHFGGGFFTMVLDAPLLGGRRGKVRDFEPGEGWREYKRQLAVLRALLDDLSVDPVVTADEYERAHANGRVAAVFACEGGDHLDGDPSHVEELYADGVRHIQLFHVASNPLVEMGDEGRDAGLTAIGREVVREMNRLGMVIDLGHASFTTAPSRGGAQHRSDHSVSQPHPEGRRQGIRNDS